MTDSIRPICFMVMPYRTKPVPGATREGVPGEIDFDALWERVYAPSLEQLGYQAVRGDYDPSSVILKEMLERLAWADLVVADVTLANGNVYYEVGMRHVAKETSCVLVAADWSQPLFDISAFSCIRFPLHDGAVPEAEAATAREVLVAKIPMLRDVRTPYYELVDRSDGGRRSVFRDQIDRIAAFQSDTRALRLLTDASARAEGVRELCKNTATPALGIPEVAVELLTLVRDSLDWKDVLAFFDTLPPVTRAIPFVEEQRLLAVGRAGDLLKAVAALEMLIKTQGETAERCGLLGSQYKRLWLAARGARTLNAVARPAPDERRWLNAAINSYSSGMALDLNEYYCSSNIARLLMARAEDGDAARAQVVDVVLMEQCRRLIARGASDEWLRPTLLTAAFRAGDIGEARRLTDQVIDDGPVAWKVASVLADLDEDLRQLTDTDVRAALAALRDELATLR